MTTVTTNAILDANVYVRAVTGADESALEWTQRLGKGISAHAPDLLWPETANSLLKFARSGSLTGDEALEAFALIRELPLTTHAMSELSVLALDSALTGRLSAYDATSLVLAQALDAPLVTFDKGFAGLYDRLELLS